MCGIAGLMTLDGAPPPAAPLGAMEAALRHRGPDGDGHYRSGDVGMVQTRLAIIDLATGAQPLYEPGGAALIANGEIYNYIELREDLRSAARPIAFSTQSDCEVPLHLYRRYGLEFTLHLRGMYAVALHDPGAGRLVLSRDPFGIKPLYYAETPHGFAFASEPRALIEAGIVAPELYRRARNELCRCSLRLGARRSLPGSAGCCRAKPWSYAKAGLSSGSGARHCPNTDRSPSPKRRRWLDWTPYLPTACAFTSARTCRSACFFPEASIRPQCW